MLTFDETVNSSSLIFEYLALINNDIYAHSDRAGHPIPAE